MHSDIPNNEINYTMKAVAAEISISFNFIIYSLQSHNLNDQILYNLYAQLPSLCLIIGDFNAYSIQWGSPYADSRGRIIESFLLNNNEMTLDLSICSPSIAMNFNWSVLNFPFDSDYCPILIEP